MEHPENCSEIILGVDTHLDVHVGVVIDAAGRVMGTLAVETNNDGYRQLLSWAQKFGVLRRAGVEGTGSYGAALTHALQSSGVTVIEINRPDRSRRRGRGKSDATDAQSAARYAFREPTLNRGDDCAIRRRCVRRWRAPGRWWLMRRRLLPAASYGAATIRGRGS